MNLTEISGGQVGGGVCSILLGVEPERGAAGTCKIDQPADGDGRLHPSFMLVARQRRSPEFEPKFFVGAGSRVADVAAKALGRQDGCAGAGGRRGAAAS